MGFAYDAVIRKAQKDLLTLVNLSKLPLATLIQPAEAFAGLVQACRPIVTEKFLIKTEPLSQKRTANLLQSRIDNPEVTSLRLFMQEAHTQLDNHKNVTNPSHPQQH